jgi:hypothetical protein
VDRAAIQRGQRPSEVFYPGPLGASRDFLQLLIACCVLSAGIDHKHINKEIDMGTFATKLAALAGTLFMNTLVMGAVACCFAIQPNAYTTAVALAKAVAMQQGLG